MLKALIACSLLMVAASVQADTITTTATAQIDYNKSPVARLIGFGPTIQVQLKKTVVAEKIEWTGYAKSYVCLGEMIPGVDGEMNCSIDEVVSWVPEVKVLDVVETNETRLTTEINSDVQTQKTKLTYTLNTVCIENYESYRYFGEKAPETSGRDTLTVRQNCDVMTLDNRIVYFENTLALKGHFMSVSLYRSGILSLNNSPLTLNYKKGSRMSMTTPTISLQPLRPNEYPAISFTGYTNDKKHLLFGTTLLPDVRDIK